MTGVPLEEVLHWDVVTTNAETGVVSDADAAPTWEIFEEAIDTPIRTGSFTKRTGKTGNYRGSDTVNGANGFEAGKFYSIVASATVNGIGGKCLVKTFRALLGETEPGQPTVAPGENSLSDAVLGVGFADAIAAALLDLAAGVETNRTVRQAMRLILAAAAGKASGLAGTTAVYRDTNDTVDRISATVDASGNRSAVTLDDS